MPHIVQVFVTLGFGVVLEALAHLLWSADFRYVRTEYSNTIVEIAGARVTLTMMIASGFALAASALIYAFLKWTEVGAAIRATAQDPYAANVVGIETQKVYAVTFGVGIGCAGLAGALLAPIYPAFPSVGLGYSLIAFVVVILGGLGSFPGAIVGGFLVGILETFSAYYISPAAKEATYFIVFILVLVLRPAGLLGLRGSELIGVQR
jgi:branched-chain amino acid transport system permease protein